MARVVKTVTSTTLLLAAALLGGCSDGGTGPGADAFGTGSVQITGSVSRSISGLAIFGRDVLLGTDAFAIVIADFDQDVEVGVVLVGAGRPGRGSYSLGDVDSPRYGEVAIGSTWYESESGQLTIDASTAEAVRGTMSFSARRVGGQGQINVSASFNATCTPTGSLGCD